MQASSWRKDTSSGKANECVRNVIDATHVAVVFDGDDVKSDSARIDVVDAQEVMCCAYDALLFLAVHGFNARSAEPPLAHLDFHKNPRLATASDEVNFKTIPSPIAQEYLGFVFFKVNDRKRLSPAASFSGIHAAIMRTVPLFFRPFF
jgi:hypothetical protein